MWVGQKWNGKEIVRNEVSMRAEPERLGNGLGYLDYGQGFSLDSKCSEK